MVGGVDFLRGVLRPTTKLPGESGKIGLWLRSLSVLGLDVRVNNEEREVRT
jgi:hypothetical protein